MLNLDTHVLLYALLGDLTARESEVLGQNRWAISAIVLWEIAKLAQKGRIVIGLDHPMLVQKLTRLEILPISREVCAHMLALDFKSDPADELIAATSLLYRIPLVTRDLKIRASKILPFAC